MSGAQRRKGAGGERELCALLSADFGFPVKRKLSQARDSGFDVDLPPFNIEVKRRKRIANLYDWLAQADNGSSLMPTVMLRADGRNWLVVMAYLDWVRLAREEIAHELPRTNP